MKVAYKMFISSIFILIVTGCIAEDYDFTPPTVSIVNTYDITDEEELEAANINWDSDKKYTKDTKDIDSFAKEQKLLSYEPEEKMDITFDNQDFLVHELNVYAIKMIKRLNCHQMTLYSFCQMKRANMSSRSS